MSDLYLEALNHTLSSRDQGEDVQFAFKNLTPVRLNVMRCQENGDLRYMTTLRSRDPWNQAAEVDATRFDADAGSRFVIVSASSGAFCCAIDNIELTDEDVVESTIHPRLFLKPNSIGPFPGIDPEARAKGKGEQLSPPTAGATGPARYALIPRDGDRVVVGVGSLPPVKVPTEADPKKTEERRHTLIREQFWRRGSESYVLAPGEERTISVTHTSGREETSSTQETVSACVSGSASGSWGAFSASISASLSASSSSMHQVTVREQETRYEFLRSEKSLRAALHVPSLAADRHHHDIPGREGGRPVRREGGRRVDRADPAADPGCRPLLHREGRQVRGVHACPQATARARTGPQARTETVPEPVTLA